MSLNNNTGNKTSESVTLSRNLNLFTITMIGVGGMIGAGIFVLTGIAAGVAGPALILTFGLNGIITTFTALSYAELGSAFPEAGGGYLWVKQGLGGAHGFLAGWMSWFANVAAGSLYALGFGRFASELWLLSNFPTLGLDISKMTLLFMSLIIITFTIINYRGVSETGVVGNIITMTKVVILFLFVFFGISVMLRSELWYQRFTVEFLPNGISGVIFAMGLTFIAFEGYEIIVQSGEEAIDPQKNIPRSIFLAILIAVSIYILVGITVIGATIPPFGEKVYEYLGKMKEIAVVEVAQQILPFGIGGLILLFSGLVSTMSALNATTYSSSRVSFAMGRDHNLPSQFSLIHKSRHTPFMAIFFSGIFMLLIAWVLPIEDVAAAADVMFLMLFLQVNITVMALRHKLPDKKRYFRVPWMPIIPLLAIASNGILVINLFSFSPIAWIFAVGWIVVGLLLYLGYFSKIEALEKPKEILLEEVLVSRDYSVVVPVSDHEQANILGYIGAMLAHDNGGEILALHVIKVPPQLTLGEGRMMLKEGRPYLETVIEQARNFNVPVHNVLRLGRNVSDSIRKTVDENAADLLLIGWPGYTTSAGRSFGAVIDPILDDPPTDIALVRYRERRPVRKILVPVGGGPNSRRATKIAVNMARYGQQGGAQVNLLHVVPPSSGIREQVRAKQLFDDCLVGINYPNISTKIVEGSDIAQVILDCTKGNNNKACDLIVIGATNEPLFKNILIGSLIENIVKNAKVTVIVVKRRSSPLHSFLRQTVLEPSSNNN